MTNMLVKIAVTPVNTLKSYSGAKISPQSISYFSPYHSLFFFWFAASKYRLFFLRSIAQFFTQIYMNCFVSS